MNLYYFDDDAWFPSTRPRSKPYWFDTATPTAKASDLGARCMWDDL